MGQSSFFHNLDTSEVATSKVTEKVLKRTLDIYINEGLTNGFKNEWFYRTFYSLLAPAPRYKIIITGTISEFLIFRRAEFVA